MSEIFDFQEFPILATERLIMRELSEDDAPALFEFYRDPEFTRFIIFAPHTSLDDSLEFVAFMKKIYQEKDSVRWGIELKETGKLIGNAGIHFWKRDIRCAEVGYHIGQAYQGRGFATEVLGAMVKFGFERMNLNRIQAYINPGNDASGRVLEKRDFKKEGVWRQVELKNGKLIDKIWFSLLREEYGEMS